MINIPSYQERQNITYPNFKHYTNWQHNILPDEGLKNKTKNKGLLEELRGNELAPTLSI